MKKELLERYSRQIIIKDIGFNADDNEVSIFYKNKSSEKISKTNKSLIANEIVKRVTQEFN